MEALQRTPRVSIVIPHLAGEHILRRCLVSVFESDFAGYEVLLVDNASSDGSVGAARAAFPEIRVISCPVNLGFAGGCNAGIRQAGGEYVLLLNDDAVLERSALRRLVEYADAHASAAAVQPKLLSLTNRHRFDYAGAAGGCMDKYGFTFARGRIFETIEEDSGQYDTAAEIFWATGACSLLRSSTLAITGDLDAYFFAHMEEIDLNWRFHLAGFEVHALPSAVVYHEAGTTLSQGSSRKLFLNHRNNLLMMLKNYQLSTLFVIFPIRWLFEWLALFFQLAQGHFAAAGAIVQSEFAVLLSLGHVVRERAKIKRFRRRSDAQVRTKMFGKSVVVQYFLRGRKTYGSLTSA